MFTGTNIYSIVFNGGALIGGILVFVYLTKIWKPLLQGEKVPSVVAPMIKTTLVCTLFIVVLTLAWNIKQSVTTTTSVDYKRPAEIAEQKKVMESQIPTPEELSSVRSSQKEKEEKRHEAAVDSFDEKMKKEAEKTKQRNQ
jgi:hypothetical protein